MQREVRAEAARGEDWRLLEHCWAERGLGWRRKKVGSAFVFLHHIRSFCAVFIFARVVALKAVVLNICIGVPLFELSGSPL